MSLSTTILEERTTGRRTVNGTEWTISDRLVALGAPQRGCRWQIVSGLCNGVPDSGRLYRSLAAARAAWGTE